MANHDFKPELSITFNSDQLQTFYERKSGRSSAEKVIWYYFHIANVFCYFLLKWKSVAIAQQFNDKANCQNAQNQ